MGISALAQMPPDPSLAARKKGSDAVVHHTLRALWPYDRGIDAALFR
jgi:hypothetical protein